VNAAGPSELPLIQLTLTTLIDHYHRQYGRSHPSRAFWQQAPAFLQYRRRPSTVRTVYYQFRLLSAEPTLDLLWARIAQRKYVNIRIQLIIIRL
jgi:hypothetical protein